MSDVAAHELADFHERVRIDEHLNTLASRVLALGVLALNGALLRTARELCLVVTEGIAIDVFFINGPDVGHALRPPADLSCRCGGLVLRLASEDRIHLFSSVSAGAG